MSNSPSAQVPPPPRSRAERCVKAVFLLILLVFPVQYWISRHITEPYPALMMPAFTGNAFSQAGKFPFNTADVVVHFEDGTTNQLTISTLFAEAPYSHRRSMARIGMKPRPGGPPPEKIYAKSRIMRFLPESVVPGLYVRKRRTTYWAGPEPETIEWAKQRIQELYPGRAARQIEVIWYRDEVTWASGQLTSERTLDTIVPIVF
jgi:hypothetical protein